MASKLLWKTRVTEITSLDLLVSLTSFTFGPVLSEDLKKTSFAGYLSLVEDSNVDFSIYSLIFTDY